MSMKRTIARSIARANMKQAGLERLHKKRRFDKNLHVAGESLFSRNWRKFCTSSAAQQTRKRRSMRKRIA